MKILHLIPLHIPASGIIRQAVTEQQAARAAGLDWDVRLFTDVDLPVEAESLRISTGVSPQPRSESNWFAYVMEKVKHRRLLYQWLEENHSQYDAILLRYTTSDISRSRALRRITTPIVSVHHTLELPELKLDSGYRRWLRVLFEVVAATPNIRASAAIAGVTPEIVRYELARGRTERPAVSFPNGIDLSEHPVAADNRGSVPEFAFVASSFAPWHGLDRVLNAVSHSEEDFVLHLVGNVSEVDRASAQLDPRIRIHGHVDPERLADIISRSWVGLSSFAMDRLGMTQACSLKVREYLASGLPTYAGHADRFPTDAVYYQEGPADIETLLKFAYETRSMSRDHVRSLSATQISKSNILADTHRQICAIFNRG